MINSENKQSYLQLLNLKRESIISILPSKSKHQTTYSISDGQEKVDLMEATLVRNTKKLKLIQTSTIQLNN